MVLAVLVGVVELEVLEVLVKMPHLVAVVMVAMDSITLYEMEHQNFVEAVVRELAAPVTAVAPPLQEVVLELLHKESPTQVVVVVVSILELPLMAALVS